MYRGVNAVGRSVSGRRRGRDRLRTAAGGCGPLRSAAAAVRVGREQCNPEDHDGRGDGCEQRNGRRRVIVVVVGGRGRGCGRVGPDVPTLARGRRFVVGPGTGAVDHAVAHQPRGQAQAVVAGAPERALVRRPPGRAQRTVRVARQMVKLGPRDLELRLVRVLVAHEPHVHVTPPPPPLQPVPLRRVFGGRRRDRDGRLLHVIGRKQRQVLERGRVVSARRHERIVQRPGRQVHLQTPLIAAVRHEVYLREGQKTEPAIIPTCQQIVKFDF